MADYPGWYPPGQVCYPPELPTYLKNVYDLKPITGVPIDKEVIGIHSVIQAANRTSSIPGMYNPGLFMELQDHLFSAQMAVYRSKYTSLLFPSDATYKPPTLPTHVSVNLEPISGAPSDEQVTKVQEAIRSFQKYSEIPSMFEPRVSAELSQHLFDIQMARYMSRAAQRQSRHMPHEATQRPTPATAIERATDIAEETSTHDTTNNAGTGAGVVASHELQEVGIRDILERSNQLVERANQLSERSNQLIERSNRIAEQSSQPIERSDHPVEQPERSTDQPSNLSEQLNELTGRLNHHLERSNQLVEEYKKPVEQLGDVLRTINKVLVGIQHAIVRNHRDNTKSAINCLVNEKGDIPPERFEVDLWKSSWVHRLGFKVEDKEISTYPTDDQVVRLLRFYDIGENLFEDREKTKLDPRNKHKARPMLSQYWSSALGT